MRFQLPLSLAFLTGLFGTRPDLLRAQVQVRLGDSTRILYSELHDGLRRGTPAADSVRVILEAQSTSALWPMVAGMLRGAVPWNSGLLALTRIAELRDPSSLDSARAWRERIESGQVASPPTTDSRDLLPALHAIELELARRRQGDLAVLGELIPRIPVGDYDLGDAWVFGRLRDGAADSLARRFLATRDQALRIRYLTLFSFSDDTALIPLMARIYVAPDSFGLPIRIGIRASDGLLWIGTRHSVEALLAARTAARARGTYADPGLGHADLDFLANDSSMAVSRTGLWLAEWLKVLKPSS